MSRKTVEHMTWHLNCYNENEKIFHPACGEAWKHFDSTHPEFASESRNVRLGLCIDCLTPFGHSASPYSCWPVFVSVYNLPPTMCMKQEYVFLSLIIQGPQSLGKNIDVNDMAIWQKRTVEIICELERIFPPSFFDSMEHLAIHLPYETHVGGPYYDFYGVLQEIIQIEYYGLIHRQAIVLFKCDWYEIPPAQGVQVDQKHPLVDINPRRYLRSYESFILASQARQVYYTPYPSINHERRGWIAALKIKARIIIEAPENKDDQQEGLTPYFQDDEPPIP
ncbi:hypothetical protein SLEP1_g40235 [Rubroshorea leprosula]|uniref:DUF4216 domain-containing protein n=1 Tax=Rubroshorea leprosula TaxID=152421 RepID=A0AAV5L3M8_9ROSI|nr:hypothetical protein SLEP1_g40235 [Rubroshorea leprosula]